MRQFGHYSAILVNNPQCTTVYGVVLVLVGYPVSPVFMRPFVLFYLKLYGVVHNPTLYSRCTVYGRCTEGSSRSVYGVGSRWVSCRCLLRVWPVYVGVRSVYGVVQGRWCTASVCPMIASFGVRRSVSGCLCLASVGSPWPMARVSPPAMPSKEPSATTSGFGKFWQNFPNRAQLYRGRS